MVAVSPYAPSRSTTTLHRPETWMAVLLLALGAWNPRTSNLLRQASRQVLQWIATTWTTKVQSHQKSLNRVRENQQYIHQVLQYWFGQYPPDQAQKQLWMINHAALKERIDREITEQFEWLLIELATDQRWKEWCHDPIYGAFGKIAAIIVLDQFSRHILRHYQSPSTKPSSSTSLPTQTHFDTCALKTAKLFMEQHAQEISCAMIPLPMYIFSLMPYRHASTKETVEWVQQRIEDCAGWSIQLDAMLVRFRKATNRRLAVLQDAERRKGTMTCFADDDILETFPFEADMGPAKNHIVVKTIQAFLEDRGIQPNHPTPTPLIVSLSGGVDSMVIASVLVYLKQSLGYALDIWAVHIDYANRPESGAEADFVRRYCERLSISFQCRRIDEVTRGVTARDEYERIARELRYQTYKETIALAGPKDPSMTPITIGVLLGHHRGDLRENVLSNAHKGCGPLDLSGMTPVSRNDGVVIYRPLLPLEKSFVFDYAHKFGVPYFKGKSQNNDYNEKVPIVGMEHDVSPTFAALWIDTTPHWSTRGKLRNQLIPLLEDIYGEGSMKNLSNLAVESDECRALLQKSMIGPFLDCVQRRPMGIFFETTPWKEQPVFFWKFVLREALHSARFGMFSDKSVLSFLERVQASQVRSGWLQCRRDYAVYLQDDGRVYVLHPSSFPFAKQDMYDVIGQGT